MDFQASSSSTVSTKPLRSMEQLECHFNWRPLDDSTKSNLDDVIKKTERKTERDPRWKIFHLCTLAYLHTMTTVKNFNKASELLKEALKADEKIQKDGSDDWSISSEFVIRANLLFLRQKRNRDLPLSEPEIADDMKKLNELWSDQRNRACVYGLKGAAFNCFGPKKYPIGADAFAEASKLQPDNFDWLFGEALTRARCSRQTYRKPTEDHLLTLWKKAREIGEAKSLTSARFYANYAEAILHNSNLADLCLHLADKAATMILNATKDEKDASHIVYIICLKVYRKYNDSRDNEATRNSLIQEAWKVPACCRDAGFYLELSKMAENREDAIRFLKEGKKYTREPGHIFLELLLLEYESRDWTQEQTEQEYSSLRETFSLYRKNLCIIDFNRGYYLLSKGDVERAIEFCASAYEQDRLLSLVPVRRQEAFFCELRKLVDDTNKYKEYLAWYADNINDFCQELNIESLYRESMRSTCVSEQFVIENLGRYFLKQKEFDHAADCFKELPTDHKGRRELLAESLLCNPARTVQMLEDCLEYGCKDASMAILTALQELKAKGNAWQQVQTRAAKRSAEKNFSQDRLHFDKAVYEVCAKIKIALQHSNSYFLDHHNSGNSDESVQTKIAELLELNGSTSSLSSNDDRLESEERGSLMRSNRLDMTVLHLQNMPNSQVQLNNRIVSVMKKSKEILDRSIAPLFNKDGRVFAYVHAFNEMKKMFDTKNKKSLQASKPGAERKKLEMNLLMGLLQKKPELRSAKSVSDFLKTAVGKNLNKNFHQNSQTRDLFSFMVNREQRILCHEDGWMIRWIYLVNIEKHGGEILVRELNELLRSDWSGDGECKRTAYDVAHLAAEFAEETWVAFAELSNQRIS